MPNLLPPHRIHTRCSVCQLWNTNRQLFDLITEQVISGQTMERVKRQCDSQGERIPISTLHRHKKLHLLPEVQRQQEIRQIGESMGHMSDALAPMDSSQVLLRTILAKIYPQIQNIDVSKIDAETLLRIASQIAQTLSYSQKAAADIKLSNAKLMIEELKAATREADVIRIGFKYIREILKGHPALIKDLESVLQQHTQIETNESKAISGRTDNR